MIAPRFEVEDQAIERLAPEALPAPMPVERLGGSRTLSLIAGGAGLLLLEGALVWAGGLVAEQFARDAALGWATLAGAVAGFGLIGAGIWREVRGLFALGSVDRLRAELADPETRQRAAVRWLDTLPEGAALREAVRSVNDPDAVLTLLRAGPGADFSARAAELGRRAAAQSFWITAAVPSPALDGLVVAWRGARLVREVAALHGVRPGWLGTLSLLRRTAFAAAGVAATNMAVDAGMRAALSSPLLGHVAGDLAGAAVSARRMVLLARAADAACSPLPPLDGA